MWAAGPRRTGQRRPWPPASSWRTRPRRGSRGRSPAFPASDEGRDHVPLKLDVLRDGGIVHAPTHEIHEGLTVHIPAPQVRVSLAPPLVNEHGDAPPPVVALLVHLFEPLSDLVVGGLLT